MDTELLPILLELKEDVAATRATVDALKESVDDHVVKRLDGHSVRLSSLERSKWTAAGAAGVIGSFLGAFATFLKGPTP